MRKALAGCLVALLLLLGLEGLLRLSGFRFVPPRAGAAGPPELIFRRDGDVLITRPEYEQVLQPQRIRLETPPELDFRVGILGGSSVYNLRSMEAFRTVLHLRTNRFLPVINMGGISYGTVRELYHLPELLSYKPNVLILYTGHNEFEENLLNELRLTTAPLHPFDLWLSGNLRIYQAVSFAAQRTGGYLARRELLEPRVDPLRRVSWDIGPDKGRVHALYRQNLRTMVSLARSEGVPVLLSTVAYNRRIIPFMPLPGNRWHEGNSLLAAGKYEEARRAFESGLEEDQSPHRASETTNRIVREVAAESGTPLLDADAEIVKLSPQGIPGPELFQDHCHLNQHYGNVILQRLFAARILELGLLEGKK